MELAFAVAAVAVVYLQFQYVGSIASFTVSSPKAPLWCALWGVGG